MDSREKHSCRSAVAHEMISECLQVFNIDLTAKFSTVMLDSHAAGQATVGVELRPGALVGRDLPHLERKKSSTSFMSMTRVQNEMGTAQGIDARRKDLPRCAMTIMVSDC